MRIAIALPGFDGGAPKSVLRYAQILKSYKHEVLVCGKKGKKNLAEDYIKCGVEVYETQYNLLDKSKLRKVKSVIDTVEYILKWKADCIITVGIHLSAYVSNAVDNLDVECLCLIPGGNLTGGKRIIKTIKSRHAIVFSAENKAQLEHYGFQGDISVISNRISMCDLHDSGTYYTPEKKNEYAFLIASRLGADKSNSIKYVVDFVEWLNEKCPSTLTIAGDGPSACELKEYAQTKTAVKDKIHFIGAISDIEACYKKADICFGKGRSILEPLILGRYVVCVSEDRKMKWVDPNSFPKLEYYNFSGRNIEDPDSFAEVKELIDQIQQKESIEVLEKTKHIAEKQYGASSLEDRFYNALFKVYYENNKSNSQKRVGKVTLYVKILEYWLKTRKV